MAQQKELTLNELLNLLQKQKVVILDPEKLNEFVRAGKIVFEKDTFMSGFIRIIQLEEKFIMQEKTGKNEIALRMFQSKADAEELVKSRFETYDRMWDGCGCKINYYE